MPSPSYGSKTEEIKVRVTPEIKSRILALAEGRGEAESVIIREAIASYLNQAAQSVTPAVVVAVKPNPAIHTPATARAKKRAS